MKLNDKACKNAKAESKPFKMADGGGLLLFVQPNGKKYWRMKYRIGGKEKLLSFGEYPLLSLANAREKREEAKKLILNKIDPSLKKKQEKRQKLSESENSFQTVTLEWVQNHFSDKTDRYKKTVLSRFERDLFPAFGSMPIMDIEAPDILETLRKVENRGTHELAGRLRGLCGQVFRYAIVTGKAKRNPAQDLQGALKPYKKHHHACIEINEIPKFVQTLEQNHARLYRHTQLAVKMLMLTFVRTSEMIEATWDEFDIKNKQWRIPAERMKMENEHIVPLSNQVLSILTELKELSPHSHYIFPSQLGHKKHMSNNTVLKALERMKYKGRMTGHGFRALGLSTIKEKLGYRHEVVDRQLAHAPRNAVDRAYDRAKFLDERTVMMQEWANYLDEVK
ncbi:MAG: integrase [Alphaproteobacteria bacterium]|nr:MAG: integrase [Alphaproteobacteria bacterium]